MRILVAFLLFTLLTTGYHYNTHSIEGPSKDLETDSRIFAGQLNGAFSRIRLVSSNLAVLLPSIDWENKPEAEIQKILHSRVDVVQYASLLGVFDKNGKKKALSSDPDYLKLDIKDREYFIRLRDVDSASFWTGPVKNRVDNSASYLYVTAIKKNNVFNGVLVVAVTLEHFNTMCAQTISHTTQAILSKSSGEVLAGCGIASNAIDPLKTKSLDIFPDVNIAEPHKGVFRNDNHLYVVTRLKENQDLLVVTSASLKDHWLELYRALVSELLLFALSMLAFLIPVGTKFRNT